MGVSAVAIDDNISHCVYTQTVGRQLSAGTVDCKSHRFAGTRIFFRFPPLFSRIAFVVSLLSRICPPRTTTIPASSFSRRATFRPFSLGILITIFKRWVHARLFSTTSRRVSALFTDLICSRESRGKTDDASLHTILRSLYFRFTRSDDRRASITDSRLAGRRREKRGTATRGKSRRVEGKIWSETTRAWIPQNSMDTPH